MNHRTLREDGHDLAARDSHERRCARMQMRDAADLRPVAMDLRVNAPFRGNLHRLVAARVIEDSTCKLEDENLVDPHRGLLGPRARRHQDNVGVGNADRNVPVEAERFLDPERAAHDRQLAPQSPFLVRNAPLFRFRHDEPSRICARGRSYFCVARVAIGARMVNNRVPQSSLARVRPSSQRADILALALARPDLWRAYALSRGAVAVRRGYYAVAPRAAEILRLLSGEQSAIEPR